MNSRLHPSISVIIPVHNGGENFVQCLLALTNAEPPPTEIIVVTDRDTDGSGQRARQLGARVTSTSARRGPARARNLGAKLAQGDILFFVDADVVVRPDAVAQIATTMGQEPDLAALIGSYDDAPGALNFLSQYKNLLHHYVHQTSSEEASTFWGACGAIRRQLFLDLGGFDPVFSRPSIEDIELGYRLKRESYRIRLDKSLQVKHLKRWDAILLTKTDFVYRALPWTELIMRERLLRPDLNLGYASRASVVLAYAFLAGSIGALMWPGLLVMAGLAALSLVVINIPLYRFFYRKRGLWFSLRAIPWHWFYYSYSGLAFVVGAIGYLLRGLRRTRTRPEPTV